MEQKEKMSRERKKYLGIREIAKMAEVSTATVSRVMNHPEQCSEDTRERVSKIIKENNYIPNDTIKTIFSNTSNIIAIFIHDINNPFFTRLVLELNNLCFRNHYMLLICDTENNQEKEQAYLEFCIAKRCVGIILTEGTSWEIFEKVEIPLVFFDRGKGQGYPFVTSNNYESARKIINYLYNLGHRKIAFIGPKGDFESVQRRYQGYKDEIQGKNLEFNEEYVYCEEGDMRAEMGMNGLRYFLSLEDPPTAVFCSCDIIALGVVNAAAQMNISIPDKLSVCGFDHVMDDYFHMQLTTMEQNIEKIAEALFQGVVEYRECPQRKILETKFIYGETCARVMEE